MNDRTNYSADPAGQGNETDTAQLLERLAETFPARPTPLASLLAAAHAGRRRRIRHAMAATAAAVALVGGVGAVASQAVLGGHSDPSIHIGSDPAAPDTCPPGGPKTYDGSPVPQGPDYPTNANGQTYGGGPDRGASPDLLAVVGDCGRTGYVYRDELEEPEPWAPGAGDGGPRTVDVYESDGVTVIDTFTTVEGVSGPGSEGDEQAPAPTGPGAAAVQGTWTATIAGVTNPDGSSQFDTFRDVDLTVTFNADRVRVWDGCQHWESGFELTHGEFLLTSGMAPVSSEAAGCARAAPLPEVVENIRLVSAAERGRVYLHLGNGQIVVVLARP